MNDCCPLCGSDRPFEARTFAIEDLQKEWIEAFRFDPFREMTGAQGKLIQHECRTCGLGYFTPALIGDAAFYEKLSRENAWYYEENKWEFTEAMSRLNAHPHAQSVLEIGCGSGAFLKKVQQRYRVTGVEINRAAA